MGLSLEGSAKISRKIFMDGLSPCRSGRYDCLGCFAISSDIVEPLLTVESINIKLNPKCYLMSPTVLGGDSI